MSATIRSLGRIAGGGARIVLILVAAIAVVAGVKLATGHSVAAILFPLTQVLSVDPPVYSCQARPTELVHASFTVRNVTDEPLTVLGIRTSCTCTTPDVEFPLTLPSNGSCQLRLIVRAGPPASDGIFRSKANIFIDRGGTVPPLVVEVHEAAGKSPRPG